MRQILTAMALAAGFMLLAGCKEKNPSGGPRTDSTVMGASDRELSEGGIEFNSKLGLVIQYCDAWGQRRFFDRTPATQPLAIPKCRYWFVWPSTGVTLAAVVAEAKAQGIHGLGLEQVSEADLDLLSGWPQLWTLIFATGSNLSDAGLAHITALKELRVLHLSDCKITDAGMTHIRELTGLQELHLSGTKITDAGLRHLKKLKGLKELSLPPPITDVGLAYIGELKDLDTLFLEQTQVTDAGMVHLKGLKRLRELFLMDAKITDAGLAQIRALKGLQTLDLTGTAISDGGLAHLKGLKELKTLNLDQTSVTDAGLANLQGLKGLRQLYLRDTKVTDAGLADLRRALPDTEVYPTQARTKGHH